MQHVIRNDDDFRPRLKNRLNGFEKRPVELVAQADVVVEVQQVCSSFSQLVDGQLESFNLTSELLPGNRQTVKLADLLGEQEEKGFSAANDIFQKGLPRLQHILLNLAGRQGGDFRSSSRSNWGIPFDGLDELSVLIPNLQQIILKRLNQS